MCDLFSSDFLCNHLFHLLIVIIFISTESRECLLNPCLNGATCFNYTDGLLCECAMGFNGLNCEFAISCDQNPCLNGASCVNNSDGYQCICDFGWRGMNCETEIDECERMNCMNGAICFDLVAGFVCFCQPGFEGLFCETSIFLSDLTFDCPFSFIHKLN